MKQLLGWLSSLWKKQVALNTTGEEIPHRLHWAVRKNPDGINYVCHAIVLNEEESTFTVRTSGIRSTITELFKGGACLIIEVDDIASFSNSHVLFNAQGGAYGVISNSNVERKDGEP